MSVIINDFEIIPEPSGEEGETEPAPAAEAGPTPAPIRPIDIAEIVDREERRRRRLRAH